MAWEQATVVWGPGGVSIGVSLGGSSFRCLTGTEIMSSLLDRLMVLSG